MGSAEPIVKAKPGDLRLWWHPDVPREATFYLAVSSIEQAAVIHNALAEYDLFLERMRYLPESGNAQGLEVFEDGEWAEWEDGATGDDFDDWMRAREAEKSEVAHG